MNTTAAKDESNGWDTSAVPTPEILAVYPAKRDFLRIPHFCTMAWRSPAK